MYLLIQITFEIPQLSTYFRTNQPYLPLHQASSETTSNILTVCRPDYKFPKLSLLLHRQVARNKAIASPKSTMKREMEGAAATEQCPLLNRIPVEIRLMVYQYLVGRHVKQELDMNSKEVRIFT